MSRATELLKQATPLPWTVTSKEFDDEHAVSAKGWDELATVYGNDDSDELSIQGEANAALIVYAVNRLPDYEAAVEALERLCDYWFRVNAPEDRTLRQCFLEAQDALARLREGEVQHVR